MPNKTNLNRLALGLLASMLFSTAYAQSTMGSLEETLTTAQKNIINQNSLDQAPTGLDDCELKYPFPPSNRSSIYDEGGADFCKKLRIRGQRMMCEIDALALEKPSGPSTTGSKIELASWSRCNLKVASVLVEGYYMPASEIERRLQICSSNYYAADPGKLPKQGFYQRFLRWATSNDLTPATTDQALEVSIKQSTPLENQQDIAGLMKCDWMYSRSRSPVIDVLPGGSSADKPSYSNGAPVKKAPSNKTSPKPAAQ